MKPRTSSTGLLIALLLLGGAALAEERVDPQLAQPFLSEALHTDYREVLPDAD